MSVDNELALRYLGGCLYGAILSQAGAVRPANLVRALPQGMRVSVGLIRRVLTDDERFVEVAGRFDIADRDTIRTQPFGGAVATLLQRYGGPMPEQLMFTGLARIRGGSPTYFRELLAKYIMTREDVRLLDEHVVGADWILVMEGQNEEEILFYNDLDHDEELRELWEQCRKKDLRKRDPALTAAHILETFQRPIGPRQLAFLTWIHHPQIFDPVTFVAEVLRRDDVVAACGQWFSRTQIEQMHRRLRALSDDLAGETEEVAAVDLAEILAASPPATPYQLDEDDRINIMAVMAEAQVPIGVDELIVDLLEITPERRKFAAAVHAVDQELAREPSLLRVSPGRYLSRDAIPEWVHEVPGPLYPTVTDDERDVLLELDALPVELREQVLDPYYEDVGCGVDIEPSEDQMAGDETTYPLLHHHYVMGTMALRKIDRTLFDGEAPLTLVLMRAADGIVCPVWVNRELGLLFGLLSWYQRELPPSGGVFTIRRGDEPDIYVLDYDGRVDDELAPDEERMNRLERKRERVSHRPISTFDLMVELLAEHDAGLSFNALWAEMNVVRATSRWQIASLLAYYPCFVASDGVWSVDAELVREPGDPELQLYVIGAQDEEAEAEEEESPEE